MTSELLLKTSIRHHSVNSFAWLNIDDAYTKKEIYKVDKNKNSPTFGEEILANTLHTIDALFQIRKDQKAMMHFHMWSGKDKNIYGLSFPNNPLKVNSEDIELARELAQIIVKVKQDLGSSEIHVPDTHLHRYYENRDPAVNEAMYKGLIKEGFSIDFHYGKLRHKL